MKTRQDCQAAPKTKANRGCQPETPLKSRMTPAAASRKRSANQEIPGQKHTSTAVYCRIWYPSHPWKDRAVCRDRYSTFYFLDSFHPSNFHCEASFPPPRITSLCEVAFRIFKFCHESCPRQTSLCGSQSCQGRPACKRETGNTQKKKLLLTTSIQSVISLERRPASLRLVSAVHKTGRPPSPNSDQSANPLPNIMLQEKSL